MDVVNLSVIIVIGLVIITGFFYFFPIGLWFAAQLGGVNVSLMELFFMKFRKAPVAEIIKGLIMLSNSNIIINRKDLEVHALCKGDVMNVVNGMITARKIGLDLSFEKACALDFQNINIAENIVDILEKQE